MALIETRNVALEVESHGNPDDPAVVLIAGLGFQLIDWPLSFCETLVDAGYRVIRFDNRDIGLSQKLDDKGVPDPANVAQDKLEGNIPNVPYRLSDMAEDVANILDVLEVEQAHIVGMSMGGMIAQLFAFQHSSRCLSLTSIMSSSSDSSLPGPSPEASAILASAPQSQEILDIVQFGLRVNEAIGSPAFRWDRAELIKHIQTCCKRCYSPGGYMRQYAAVMAAPSRREILEGIAVPSLVIHGDADPLVQLACGADVAAHIPDAIFEKVSGMGHDLSPSLCAHLATLVLPHFGGATS
ncbi:hypothetical protein A9Q83_01000 [Alphaproteobacteria bacterium 46_93_T64]|nr:hypothetical protein A9Q83_01000 [Alphaproteobacteria bacterium 46_93_T64]